MYPAFFCFFVDTLGECRRGGRHIDCVRAGAEVCENAVCTEVDFLHVLRIADNGDDDILSARTCAGTAAVFCPAGDESVPLRFCAVVDAELKSCIQEMSRHGRAHDAKSDKSDLFHNICPPFHYIVSAFSVA